MRCCKFFVLFIILFHTVAFAGGVFSKFAEPINPQLPARPLIERRSFPPLPPLAITRSPLPPLVIPTPIEEVSDKEVSDAENSYSSESTRQQFERFSEIARRLLHEGEEISFASEKQEFQELFNSLMANQHLDLNSRFELCLLICELCCFGCIEQSIRDRDASIKDLIDFLRTSEVNAISAKALYILLFTLSTIPNDEIAKFMEVISDVFEIFPKYLQVQQDLRHLICLGYGFLKLAHKKNLPIDSIGQGAYMIVSAEINNLHPNPLVRILAHIFKFKLAMSRTLHIEASRGIYNFFISERNKFRDSKFVDGHIKHLLLVLILNKNSGFSFSEDELTQGIFAIFSDYNFDNYYDLMSVLKIINDVIHKERFTLFFHLENSRHLVRFLQQKISRFSQEHKNILSEYLWNIMINTYKNLLISILSANNKTLSEDELIQKIFCIFPEYDFCKFNDIKDILRIIKYSTNEDRSAIICHLENSQHFLHFLQQKILLFPEGEREFLLKYLEDIKINIQQIFLIPILNQEANLHQSEEGLIQSISDIFPDYDFKKSADLKRCLSIIIGVIHNERHTIVCHVENSQYIVNFFKEKISQFPQEQKALLLEDLWRLSLSLLETLVPKKYEEEHFVNLNQSRLIFFESGLFRDTILSFFCNQDQGSFVADQDGYAVMFALKKEFDTKILKIAEVEISGSELRSALISSALLFIVLDHSLSQKLKR